MKEMSNVKCQMSKIIEGGSLYFVQGRRPRREVTQGKFSTPLRFARTIRLVIMSHLQIIKIVLLTSILLTSTSLTTFAQSETSTTSPSLIGPTNSVEDREIQNLKEKIATKVAQLREKNNKAVSGIVQEVNPKNGEIKVKTAREEDFKVKIDPDLTKFYQISGNQKKEIKSSDVKKDSYIIVSGIINDKNIEANFIYVDELFLVDSGKVTEVNKDDFFVKLITLDKDNYTLDVERFTKQRILNIKTLELENISTSKMKEGDTIHFVVKKTVSPVEPNRYAAQKILIVPQEYFIK